MQLYSAGEIVKKLQGVTTRQILDLAEKGFILPIRESTGAGSPRLYSFQNVFDICVCLTIRGRIPAGTATLELTKDILKYIKIVSSKGQLDWIPADKRIKDDESDLQFVKNEKDFKDIYFPPYKYLPPTFDLLYIAYEDKDKYSFFNVSLNEKIGEVLARSKKFSPQNYCTYIIEVSALWSYLKTIF